MAYLDIILEPDHPPRFRHEVSYSHKSPHADAMFLLHKERNTET